MSPLPLEAKDLLQTLLYVISRVQTSPQKRLPTLLSRKTNLYQVRKKKQEHMGLKHIAKIYTLLSSVYISIYSASTKKNNIKPKWDNAMTLDMWSKKQTECLCPPLIHMLKA